MIRWLSRTYRWREHEQAGTRVSTTRRRSAPGLMAEESGRDSPQRPHDVMENGVVFMSGALRRHSWRVIGAGKPKPARPRRTGMALTSEPLEERQLLSVYTGFSQVPQHRDARGNLHAAGQRPRHPQGRAGGAWRDRPQGAGNQHQFVTVDHPGPPALSPCRPALVDPRSHDQVRTDRATSWQRLSSLTAR